MNKTFSDKIVHIIEATRNEFGTHLVGSTFIYHNSAGIMTVYEAHKAIMDAVRELVPEEKVCCDGSDIWNDCREEILKRMGE